MKQASIIPSCLAVFGCTAAVSTAAEPPRPNIVFIMVDTLRADGLGAYGNPRALTPTMDEIAAEGVVFERTISAAPWTLPSVVSLFCSRYPSAHGITDFGRAEQIDPRQNDARKPTGRFIPTLADSLKSAGYVTAAFVANTYVRRGVFVTQGFDLYDSSFAMNTAPGRIINDAAIEWLQERDTSRPFFLYLHYMDVHGPYDASPEYLDELLDGVEALPHLEEMSAESRKAFPAYIRGTEKPSEREMRLENYREYWVARYEAGIREMDDHIADLRDRLRSMGLWDDAYVIVTADHGEALGEHDLWNHGLSAHDTDLHVPLIMRWRGTLPSDQRVGATVRLIDVMPTLLRQLELPAVEGVQGVSLLPTIEARQPSKTTPAFSEAIKNNPSHRALYFDSWKLMELGRGTVRLYDLSKDPDEMEDVSGRFPERVRVLRDMLQQQAERNALLQRSAFADQVRPTAEDLERLKALGYAD